MARTDARATRSLEEAIARCQEFVRLGADITFLEAPRSVDEMKTFCEQVPGPKLANMVEMGLTPILLPEQLHEIGYKIALYPVTLLNASIKVMQKALVELRNQTGGTTTTTESGVNATPSSGLNELLSDFEHVKDVVGFTEYYTTPKRNAMVQPTSLVQSRTVAFTSYYEGTDCTGIPQFIYEEDVDGCDFVECQALSIGDSTNSTKVDCYQNDRGETAAIFAEVDAPYIIQEQYTPPNTCDSLVNALTFYADGVCRVLPNITSYAASIAVVNADLSLQLQLFDDAACTEVVTNMSIASSDVEWTCLVGFSNSYGLVYYTTASATYNSMSNDGNVSTSGSDFIIVTAGSDSASGASALEPSSNSTNTSSGSKLSVSAGVIAAIVVGCIVIVCLVAASVWWRRNRSSRRSGVPRSKNSYDEELMPQDSKTAGTSQQTGRSSEGDNLWNDEVIVAARIPREKVLLEQRISRGGYGEVYVGTFNGQRVAIKMLLPETRKRIQSVNEFLAEVKLMASLEHPRIVQLIGVAWDSFADLCAVSEFLEGGDLRAVLNRYQVEHRPLGFDHSKVKIALHVAHALTYMHSLEPPLVHRDLKSKNILLTNELDAKLTDFGVSRTRVDQTMTAGVGTSLWMAPEMMSGEKYNEKADMFSFGVVLSELDSHALPYANNADKKSDLAVLRLVMQGKLNVKFSESCPPAIVELGMACVARDPAARPTAAQALYQLQMALNQTE